MVALSKFHILSLIPILASLSAVAGHSPDALSPARLSRRNNLVDDYNHRRELLEDILYERDLLEDMLYERDLLEDMLYERDLLEDLLYERDHETKPKPFVKKPFGTKDAIAYIYANHPFYAPSKKKNVVKRRGVRK
ncbi:hypothetical protein CC2G_001717 [Coprinopsis cinerea AmutBmut pab1-1]|nr:hypothetical protein CC2G_001717 [Coprinopsis cinerea AmutBmut pab1-1]